MAAFLLALRYYANLTPAWLRLGKIAAVSTLSALSIAVGMALSGGLVEAQGIHQGYTYTERVCQELGQQPGRYNVRNEMEGSDWRSGGGWAIVLTSSAATRYLSGPQFSVSGPYLNNPPLLTVPGLGITEKTLVIDINSGLHGFRVRRWNGQFESTQVVIDQDQDGEITPADRIPNIYAPQNLVYELRYFNIVSYPEAYGARYVRWANMLWCR